MCVKAINVCVLKLSMYVCQSYQCMCVTAINVSVLKLSMYVC
jgi:hypothetical protein